MSSEQLSPAFNPAAKYWKFRYEIVAGVVVLVPLLDKVPLLDIAEHVKFEVQLNPAGQDGANALGVI